MSYIDHTFTLQYHHGDGGWVWVCIICGKRTPVEDDIVNGYPDLPYDFPLVYGQPNKYDPSIDCELLKRGVNMENQETAVPETEEVVEETNEEHEFTIYVVVFSNGEIGQNAASDISELLSKYDEDRQKDIVFIAEANHVAAKLYLQKLGVSDKVGDFGDKFSKKLSKGTQQISDATGKLTGKVSKFADKFKKKKS